MTTQNYQLNPFLHFAVDQVYNPTTDTAYSQHSEEFELLKQSSFTVDKNAAPSQIRDLITQKFLIPSGSDLSQHYLLKYVSIETHTLCNHKCYFCPVSVEPRARHFMPMKQFQDIVKQLSEHHKGIEGVFLNGYNEPSIDPNFIAQIKTLKQHDITVAVNSNGSGFTPETIDKIVEHGGLDYLCINLSTLDEQQFSKDRQADHLPVILRNMDYMAKKKLAKDMNIVVLGKNDRRHDAAFAAIRKHFVSSDFTLRRYAVNSRSDRVDVWQQPKTPHKTLKGCEQTGSRPLQHLHINAYGQCILCCQDYFDDYVIGDLNQNSINDILSGPEMAQLRRWSYGIEDAPEDFICRKCTFARTE